MTNLRSRAWPRCVNRQLARAPVVLAVGLLLSGCSGGGQPTASGITSVLVMKHGRIARESYYGGMKAEDRFPVFSITKSVTSALVGIASRTVTSAASTNGCRGAGRSRSDNCSR